MYNYNNPLSPNLPPSHRRGLWQSFEHSSPPILAADWPKGKHRHKLGRLYCVTGQEPVALIPHHCVHRESEKMCKRINGYLYFAGHHTSHLVPHFRCHVSAPLSCPLLSQLFSPVTTCLLTYLLKSSSFALFHWPRSKLCPWFPLLGRLEYNMVHLLGLSEPPPKSYFKQIFPHLHHVLPAKW